MKIARPIIPFQFLKRRCLTFLEFFQIDMMLLFKLRI